MLNRLSRLFQADMHAVLDQLEDPEALLKQSMREMENEIQRVEQQLQAYSTERTRSQQQLAKCKQRERDIEPQLDLCFNTNNEDLARNLVGQRLQWQKQQNVTKHQLELNEERHRALEIQHTEFIQQYEELKQKAEIFIDNDSSTNGSDIGKTSTDLNSIGKHEIELAWLQEKEKRKASSKTQPSNDSPSSESPKPFHEPSQKRSHKKSDAGVENHE